MPNDVTSGAQSPVASRSVNMPSNLPPMRAFAETRITRPSRSNAEIAADFLDLSFSLESGRALPVLTRFEGPVTLSVNGQTTPALAQDVTRLLARLRVEAGIDIRQVPAGSPASITLQLIPKRELQRLVPHAACFVAPNVSGWEEYRKMRSTPATDWTRLTTRKRMSVFLPGDVSPQEMRDCLHEEVAQALGPVNDLYRLHNSVFNDDNFHTVLTGFDMLILRAYYAPELRSGMSRAEVARRLPALLARLNPAGGHATTPARTIATPRIWKDAIEGALGGSNSTSARRQAAARAVEIARQYGWNDTRLAFALFAQGRLNLGVNSDIALASFREAERIYQSSPNTRLQAAHMGVQLAAHALSLGNNATAIRIVDSHLGPVTQAQNAALLSTLLMIKAEALEHQGDTRAAQLTRLDSLGWARYGFGTQANVGARLAEIAALAPNG
ncbi:MAG: ATP-dependent transcriptional regulator [Rhodobacterales bacterium]|nr:MAG: ATP-dependent transcriptional regulator [Rhodobacterales bacterium]